MECRRPVSTSRSIDSTSRRRRPRTQALTDADGRIRDLLERPLPTGDYRLEFDIVHEDGSFFTKAAVDLHVTDTERSTTSRCCWRHIR